MLIERVKRDFEKAKEIWPNITIPMPTVSFKLSGTRAGTAQYASGNIKLNPEIAAHNFDTFIERTPGHEAAHIISVIRYGSQGRGHGRCWKMVMRVLGYTPSRCHSYDMEDVKVRRQERFNYTCGCTTFNFSNTRHNKKVKFKN